MSDILCESCINFLCDDEEDDYVCCVNLDEDDMVHLLLNKYKKCPYYRLGDDYTIVKKQN